MTEILKNSIRKIVYLVGSREVLMCVDYICSWCSLLLYSNVVHLTSLAIIDSPWNTFFSCSSLYLVCIDVLVLRNSIVVLIDPFFIDWLEPAMWWLLDRVIVVQGSVHVIGRWDWWSVMYRYEQWWCYRDQYRYLIFLRIRTFSCTKSVIKRRKKEKYFS